MPAIATQTKRRPARGWARAARRKGFVNAMVKKVKSSISSMVALSEQEIRNRVCDIRQSYDNNDANSDQVASFCAMYSVQIERCLGFRLHDVQIQALVAGSLGNIVEMQTGEGKTVVTGGVAALSNLKHRNVHVSTTNDYLAERDFKGLQPVLQGLGLSCGLLPSGHDVADARQAYACDVTYGPGYQFGFDFLRDQVYLRNNRQSRLGQRTSNLIRGFDVNKQLMQPNDCHNVMIVDEADSVMIDEAATPLVISGAARGHENPDPFKLANRLASELKESIDFEIDQASRAIEIKETTLDRCHKTIEENNLVLARPWRIYIRNAIKSLRVLKRNVDYVVEDGEVKIVDQYTGRIFSDRTWQDGLHQAVEAKECVTIKSAPASVARITRQRYFQRYGMLSGLTGTAIQIEHEFKQVYGTGVVCIDTNLKCIRKVEPTRFFADMPAKLRAVVQSIQQRHRTAQPILVGTRTIAESKAVHEALQNEGLQATVLNGLQDEQEAEVIARAGRRGEITIATNMAGRGTDIKVPDACHELGGLHVIGFSPNASYRIDRQLAGRCARQGHPGSAQFFVSADDEIFDLHSPVVGKRIAHDCRHNGESRANFSSKLRTLQNAIEIKNYELRQSLTRQDKWMDQIRETIDKE